MLDFDEKLNEAKTDDIKKMKTWMFQEQVKIQAKKDELLDLGKELLEEKKKIERERKELDIRIQAERKRSHDNEILVAKKLKLLEEAYQKLAMEKKALECDRLNFEYERNRYRSTKKTAGNRTASVNNDIASGIIYFRGVDNQLALRKRYKELLKIFHPDNRCGDTATLQKIQTEYDDLKKQYYEI